MKFKFAVVIFLIGFLITLLGAWLKITHITFGPFNGNIALTIGTFIQGLGVLLIIIKILISKKFKDL
ncbi:gliding motility protein GldL [Chryseobacterium sp. GP-SGM7]|uniref:gliding motility protein GldL n=1 Tax=Chryseobacterium sp. GP-SGM7 TaxID=3411323 RepID=UPI003B93C331